MGDPDDDGILIEGVDDVSEVFTDGIIPARRTKEVALAWQIPNDIGTFPRIYAKIDAGDAQSPGTV